MDDNAVSGPRWPVRPIESDEFTAFARVCGTALLSARAPEDEEFRRPLTRLDRTLAAFDGDRMVGTTVVHPFTMTLPGGPRPVAGVSAVGVWPTHRRRGVLSALMRRQLADVHEAGESVAALFATEGAIYGRFGYGPASRTIRARMLTRETALRPDVPRDASLSLSLGLLADMRKEMEQVHETVAARRVGEFQRDGAWWDLLLRDEPDERGGYAAKLCVVAANASGPQGYAVYRTKGGWDDEVPDGRMEVAQVFSTTPAAEALLWEHLLGRDLVSEVSVDMLPDDTPLPHLLADRGRLRAAVGEPLWIRLVDLPRALEERSYAAPVDTVLEVADRDCPWNAGRWRLRADGAGSVQCVRTEAEPDLVVDVSQLGAAYLGSTRLGSYTAAGMATETAPRAAAELDLALTIDHEPFCSVVF
ncbi:GNAT family N-acetyltransferase [Nocardiopsis sp. RSe5-2]|uniref:GNAT family N-acetyltransferase n=1 Tax=Nocardiopsis endophytica TaxID=3018445 RepID=A0ABT4U7Z6_9ACTN|nr:GNAT family N-acetyltransferase [Nocardiopsis endophytica]MDA2813069.1 GNAT family N-acetyltransferase [Nocardiopsis endophytica]